MTMPRPFWSERPSRRRSGSSPPTTVPAPYPRGYRAPDPATFDSWIFLKFPTTPPRAAQHRWRPRAFSRGQLRRIRTLLARRRHSRQVFLFRRRTFTVLTLLIESLGVNAVDVEVAVQLREATDLLTELAFTLPAP